MRFKIKLKEMFIDINNIAIPIIVRSYKTSKSIKIFFKNNKITITKPTKVSDKKIMNMIKENEELIYSAYIKGLEKTNDTKKYWQTGETIFYKGEKFDIIRDVKGETHIHIHIQENEKKIKVILPINLTDKDAKRVIDTGIKKVFKNNVEIILQERLPYWSEITGIKYNKFTVRDAVTRYGSCVKETKSLHFSSRLIMLPKHIIDAIIVHELCHIVHANHSKNFYDLVEKYIPKYKEIDKWLKKNGKIINY